MNKILVVLIIILTGCGKQLGNHASVNGNIVKIPSYRMLNFSMYNIRDTGDEKLFRSMKPIRTPQDFIELQKKASKGDVKSHYFLFLLYFDDSACSVRSLKSSKRVADENCTIALMHLKKTVEIEPGFQFGLYKLAYFNQYGIGMPVNLDESINYWEKLIKIEGYYRQLALEAVSEIYFYEFGKIDKAKEYLTICANEGGEICQFKLGDWDNKIKLRPYILEAKQRANSPST